MIEENLKKHFVKAIKSRLVDFNCDHFTTFNEYDTEDLYELLDLVFLGKRVWQVSIKEDSDYLGTVIRYTLSEESLIKLRRLYEQYGDLL